MSSSAGRVSTRALNLYCQLCISSFLITFQSGEGFLTAKPQDAVRAIGQSVMFTCNSSWIDPIRWWFISEEGAEIIATELVTNDMITIDGKKGKGSPDGYRSSLIINNATRWHAGTFRCQDGTGSRGFARLTVTSTTSTTCLTVSPRDQVVIAGDSVVLTASNSSTRLRYYHEALADSLRSQERVELYNGLELDDGSVDERFSVIGVGDQGHADLVIRSVQPRDAGRYIVRDMTKLAFEVAANIVVFDRFPGCAQIWSQTEDNGILLQCLAKYTGQLTPRVSFLRNDVTTVALQKTGNGGLIRFEQWFDFSDLTSGDITSDIKTFEIRFELSQCGEPAGSWSWKHVIHNYTGMPLNATKRQNSMWHQPNHATLVMMASFFVVLVFAIVSYVAATVLRMQRKRHHCHDTVNTEGSEKKQLYATLTPSSSVCTKLSAHELPSSGTDVSTRQTGQMASASWLQQAFLNLKRN